MFQVPISVFNFDYKTTHEEKVHDGRVVQVVDVGAPKNPFEAAAKKRLPEHKDDVDMDAVTSLEPASAVIHPQEIIAKHVGDPSENSARETMLSSTTVPLEPESSSPSSSRMQNVEHQEHEEVQLLFSDQDIQEIPSSSTNTTKSSFIQSSSSARESSYAEFMGTFAASLRNMSEGEVIFNKHKNITILNDKIAVLEALDFLESVRSHTSDLIDKGLSFLSHVDSDEKKIKVNESPKVSAVVLHDPGLRSPITNDNEREYLLKMGPYQPTLPRFPSDGKDRFNAEWYKNYHFLEYSIAKDAAFCFVCCLFPHGPGREKAEKNWALTGVKSWGKMKSSGKGKAGKLPLHFSSQTHASALVDYCNFLKKSGHIESLLDKNRTQILIEKERIKVHNTQVINILMDVARTLGAQGIPFRGSENTDEDGNFYQIVKLISKYNPILNEWFHNRLMRHYKVKYLSHDSQNEFVKLTAAEVRADMISKINRSPFFCVMADTTPDLSHKDILSVVVRITNEDGKPAEHLLEVREAKDKTGEGLAKEIFQTLSDNMVDTSKLVSQSYDFALSMSGEYNGAQQKLSQMVGHTIPYIPCQDHRTNTVLEHSCNASLLVSSTLDVMEALYAFFTMSTKRFQHLASKLSKVVNATNLRNLSKTRWTARAETVAALESSFETIVDVLNDLSKSNDKQTKIKALGLYKKIMSADFIITLFFLKNILPKIKILTEKIESPNLNVVDCADVIKATVATLSRIRNCDQEMNNLITSAMTFAKKFNVDVEYEYKKIHHRRMKPKRLDDEADNESVSSSYEFFRADFYRVIDMLVSGLTENVERIVETIRPIFSLFKLPFNHSNITIDNIKGAIKLIPDARQRPDSSVLRSEFEVLYHLRPTANSFSELQDKNIATSLTNVFTIIQLASTIGYGVSSNERSFSQLKLVKSHLRTTMCDARLNDLLLLKCEKEMATKINLEKTVAAWRDLKDRRIQL